jgi:hypothetical protein
MNLVDFYDNVGNEVHVDSGYRIEYTFPWEGKFEVYCQWWNKCLKQDTFWGRPFDIYCDTTASTNQFIKPQPKLIGIYDMMGRPVNGIREDEIMIFLYDDGSTKKIIQH